MSKFFRVNYFSKSASIKNLTYYNTWTRPIVSGRGIPLAFSGDFTSSRKYNDTTATNLFLFFLNHPMETISKLSKTPWFIWRHRLHSDILYTFALGHVYTGKTKRDLSSYHLSDSSCIGSFEFEFIHHCPLNNKSHNAELEVITWHMFHF